jgi:uncharacterized cupredoxin-like copper-binding protein
MKRIASLSVIVAAILSATACGSSAAQPAPAIPATSQVASSAAGGGTQVEVTLADNTIDSTLTTFQAGVPYTFVIRNNGRHAHNFNISQPVSVTGSIDASLAGALLDVKQNQLPVGGGTTVTYTFPDSAVGMQLEFSCLIVRHYEDGMRLAITVTK